MLSTLHIPLDSQDIASQTVGDIDNLFSELAANHGQHLVVYIHGGLNSKSHAETMARFQKSKFGDANRHIVSLIWETGVLETINSRVSRALDQPIIKQAFPILSDKVCKYLGISRKGLGEKGGFENVNENTVPISPTEEEIVKLSQTLEDEFRQELGLDNALSIEIEREVQQNPHLSDDFYRDAISSSEETGGKGFGFSEMVPNPARILKQVTLSVLKRYANNTHHDLRETIVEELLREIYAGSFIRTLWEDMKFRAKDMWERDSLDSVGLARYFLKKLAAHQSNFPTFRIDLIGHSAGSIVICNMLATAARYYKQLKFGNIIFLAPAATMEFFYDEIVTKPERYSKFHMFTMTDEQEKNDILVKVAGWNIYGYSLLYLVAGLLEPLTDQPISGMMRYLIDAPPFDTHKLRRIKDFLTENDKERLILSLGEMSKSGLYAQSRSHGGFSQDPATIESIVELLDQPL